MSFKVTQDRDLNDYIYTHPINFVNNEGFRYSYTRLGFIPGFFS